jgi:hypothetical protein
MEWKLFNKLKQKLFKGTKLLRIFKTDKNQREKQDIRINQENVSLSPMKKFNH